MMWVCVQKLPLSLDLRLNEAVSSSQVASLIGRKNHRFGAAPDLVTFQYVLHRQGALVSAPGIIV